MTNQEAMSVAEAAASLGVSVPTVRQMVARGQLVAFRTPGGHLRFTSDSVRAAKGESLPVPPGRVPSSSLQNRRERVEELNLETTELRAERQLDALRREQEEEEADRRAEAESLRQERKDQARALVVDRQRIKREAAEERERRRAAEEAQSRQERFVSSWLGVGLALIPKGVPAEVQRDVVRKVEEFLQECKVTQEMQILRLVTATVADALSPWQREQEITTIVEEARQMLPYMARGVSGSPTVWDLKAKQAAFGSIAELEDSGSLEQVRTAARLAVQTVVEKYEAHELAEKTERQKAQLLDHWFLSCELTDFLGRLLHEDAIELDAGERLQDVVDGLKPATRRYLDQQLTGAETREEVLKLLREFVRAEFKL
ncbi:MAG: helix-turn-helix domain-containing protein [Terriglobales bacterium]